MTKCDITYKDHGLFTSFYPESKDGEIAWKQIAEQTEGTGRVLSIFTKQVIQQLRSAGYIVMKKPKVKEISMEEIFKELKELEK